MITRDIRAFVSRDWPAARAAKDQYWSDRVRRLGPIEALRAANELRRQAQWRDPDWPHVEDRREDLACHVRVAALLRRVDSARCAFAALGVDGMFTDFPDVAVAVLKRK